MPPRTTRNSSKEKLNSSSTTDVSNSSKRSTSESSYKPSIFSQIFSSHDYLSDESLANLSSYKYAATDKSLVSYYILRHYWNWAVNFFPLWMAPNLITLLGLLFMVAALFLALIVVPDLESQGPSWIYFFFAAALWLYSTFDNVDGKQARRTGSSSPLGELFDHGCDALNCSIGAVVQVAAMGVGVRAWHAVALPFLSIVPFYLSTWEEYHTGVLYLGIVNGPTEGLIIACGTMIISGIFGVSVWKTPVNNLVDLSFIYANGGNGVVGKALLSVLRFLGYGSPTDVTIIDLLAWSMFILLFIVAVPDSLRGALKAIKKTNDEIEKAQKEGRKLPGSASRNKPTSVFEAIVLQQLPNVVLFSAAFAWIYSPDSNVLVNHYTAFVMSLGIVFGRIATKIILAHLTKGPFPYFTVGLIPMVFGAIRANSRLLLGFLGIVPPPFTPLEESILIHSYLVFCVINYFYWANAMINRICAHLGIKCFTITSKAKKDQ